MQRNITVILIALFSSIVTFTGCRNTPSSTSADTLNPRRLTSGQAPRFCLPDALTGIPISTDTIIGNGRPTQLLFFSSSCSHCKNELKHLQHLADSVGSSVNILCVALDRDSASLRHYLRARHISLRVLTDYSGWQQRATVEYGVDRLPLLFHISPEGEIVTLAKE